MAAATGNAPTSTGGVAEGAGAIPATAGGAGTPGSAANSSLAIWAMTAGSNGALAPWKLLVLMVVVYLNTFEDAQSIFGKHRR